MDQLIIRNLEVTARQGNFEEEPVKEQKFLISASLSLDMKPAGKLDDPSLSPDASKVMRYMTAFMQKYSFRLLETAAERMAEGILTSFLQVEKAELEIGKAWEEEEITADRVSVRVERGWHTAYIGIGSNVGDRSAHMEKAMEKLRMRHDCRMLQESMIIETKPYGNIVQDDFLNACFVMRTWMNPEELLTCLHILEEEEGRRTPDVKWGPRVLDLDIIFYDDLVYESDDLIIPHVDMENRRYVLEPLSEIAPNKRHPILGTTVSQLYDDMSGEDE